MNSDSTAGVGDDGNVIRMDTTNNGSLQYKAMNGYTGGRGSINVTAHGQTQKTYAVDKNTVAFYYDEVVQADLNPGGDYVGSSYKAGDVIYGVAVGYDKMTDVPQGENFLAKNLSAKSGTLASTVLFDYEGVTLEKDYAFVLSRSSVDSKYATLNVVLMDGTVTTLKITRDDTTVSSTPPTISVFPMPTPLTATVFPT